MVNLLIRKFIKNYEDVNDPHVRESYGKLVSFVGIVTNAFLSITKILIGMIFNSISITADGVNNLSDTGSSIITLIGFKLGGKPADKDHPFGHARLEYIAGLIVAFVILMLGFGLIKSSFDKIINPEPIDIGALMIVVLVISIAVKLWQSNLYKTFGKKISSSTMIATSVDSRNDVITTSAILISIIVAKITGYQIDGYMGIVVAVFIIISGINILKNILNPLLGELPDCEFIESIENKILSYDGIINVHDLVVHNYGPSKYFATVHAEVDAKEDIMKSHDLIDNIERDMSRDMNINLVIHLDPVIIDDKEISNLKIMTEDIIKSIDEELTMHDFRVVKGKTHTNLIFDVLVPVDYKLQSKELIKEIERAVKLEDSAYYAVVTIDRNYVSTFTTKPNMK